MNQEIPLSREYMTEKDWLDEIFEISNSHGSLKLARTSLKALDIFCKANLELPNPDITDLENRRQDRLAPCKTPAQRYAVNREIDKLIKERFQVVYLKARNTMIAKYQAWYEQDKPDIQSICTSLQKFVRFCNKDQPDVLHLKNMSWRAKSAQSIQSYFSFIKEFLRKCYGIRLSGDDVKDFIKFPKNKKQLRQSLDIAVIKKLLTHADPRRRALYYVLLTSGMRLGEALSLKKSNFKTDVRPIQIHLHAKDTKTKEARDTFISEEAWERVQPIYDRTPDGKYLFHDYSEVYPATTNEDRYFGRLRTKIAKIYGDKAPCDEFPEGTGILKRYEESIRYCVQIHAFRAYFMTKASLKHGTDYSHGIAGHHTYLDQYIRIDFEDQKKMYLQLEKDLLLESARIASKQFHQAEVEELTARIDKLQTQIDKAREPQAKEVDWTGVTQ
jgi:integrase